MSLSENNRRLNHNTIFWKQAVVGIGDGVIISMALATALALVYKQQQPVLFIAGTLAGLSMLVMGVGGYFAARYRMESLHLKSEEEQRKINEEETAKTIALFKRLNLGDDMQEQAANEIEKDNLEWKQFLEKNGQAFELPDAAQLPATGLIIGLSYFAGAILPLIAYLIYIPVSTSMQYSLLSGFVLLPIIGFIKSKINGEPLLWGSLRLLLLGAAAVGATW